MLCVLKFVGGGFGSGHLMFFLLGVVRSLGSAWLGFHLLLWTLETTLATPQQGELCLSWTSGCKGPDSVFWCPTSLERPDAKFCCGTCRTPYCCSSARKRLDQTQCIAGEQEDPIPEAPQDETNTPTHDFPQWFFILLTTEAIVSLVYIVCHLLYIIGSAIRGCHPHHRHGSTDSWETLPFDDMEDLMPPSTDNTSGGDVLGVTPSLVTLQSSCDATEVIPGMEVVEFGGTPESDSLPPLEFTAE